MAPKSTFFALLLLTALGVPISASAQTETISGFAPDSGNPILPGYYADASFVEYQGKNYIYATIDPWGGDNLACWESSDFKTWTYRPLNWPTRKACTSPQSGGAKVWAPSVVRARDGKFYMYVSVGNEVWAGTADSPLGPWRDLLGGGKPLVSRNFKPGFHMIDAEAFIDDDGTPYLYWGSGLNWVNGKCWGAKLNKDMASFDGEVRDVTPANYFEGPFMVKHGGKYFLTYSQGNTTRDTYRVHYAIGNTPFGPFTEASNSPILVTDKALNVVSPGHHAIIWKDKQPYMLYHRHSVPFPNATMRQLCLDPLVFTADGLIAKITPTHLGLPGTADRNCGRTNLAALATGTTATASSSLSPVYGPERVLDNNYATRWMADRNASGATLQLDLGAVKKVTSQELRLEFASKTYRFVVESSTDEKTWSTLADYLTQPATGSPLVIQSPAPIQARYLRLTFPAGQKGAEIGLWEWSVY